MLSRDKLVFLNNIVLPRQNSSFVLAVRRPKMGPHRGVHCRSAEYEMRLSVRQTDPSQRCHRHDFEGTSSAFGWRVSRLAMYLATLVCPISMPILTSSPCGSRRSPQRIGNAHLADKLAYLRRYSWSATTAPRLPPVRYEPGAVPFNHGLPASRSPRRRAPSEPNDTSGEYQTVQHPERRPFRRFPRYTLS